MSFLTCGRSQHLETGIKDKPQSFLSASSFLFGPTKMSDIQRCVEKQTSILQPLFMTPISFSPLETLFNLPVIISLIQPQGSPPFTQNV